MKEYTRNKKAYFEYEILKKYEAGLELYGHEVKSIKKGSASIQGAFVVVRGGEAYLTNTTIPPYQKANTPNSYDETRARRLLLHKKEIAEIEERTSQKGLTIIPLRLYNIKGKIKVEIAVVRGKKKKDKREDIKRKDAQRNIDRRLKSR